MEFVRENRPPEVRLFQAILLQAFEDSLSVSTFKRDTYAKEDSHKWFLSNSDDFQSVCWNADLDPEVIRDEYKKLIRKGAVKFTKIQKSWINYREYYKAYRNARTKEERADIKRKIFSDKIKIK